MSASRRLLLLGLPATLALAGCGQVVKSAMSSAIGATPGSDVVTGNDTLKRAQRLVVAGFMVDYVTEFRRSAEGSMATVLFTDAPTDATISTTGVNPAGLPGLTDALYDGFVADAAAAGYEVVPHATLNAQPGYAAYGAMGKASPATEDGAAGRGIFVSARGLPLFYVPEDGYAPQFSPFGRNDADKDEFLPFTSRLTAGFSSIGPLQATQELAKGLGATAVMVRVTIAGGALQGNRSFWTGDSVKTGAGLSFAPFVTRLAFLDASGGRARVALGSPVVTADIGVLTDVTSGTTTAMDVAGNALRVGSTVAAAVLGGRSLGGGSRERNYQYAIDAAKFDPAVIAGWGQVSRKLLALSKLA